MMIIHSRRREEKQVAVSGLDKTSKCREEAVQATLANNTAPLYDTALAHTGRGAGAAACIGRDGDGTTGSKNKLSHPSPILRHIGITTDVRKGRLDGLYYSPSSPPG